MRAGWIAQCAGRGLTKSTLDWATDTPSSRKSLPRGLAGAVLGRAGDLPYADEGTCTVPERRVPWQPPSLFADRVGLELRLERALGRLLLLLNLWDDLAVGRRRHFGAQLVLGELGLERRQRRLLLRRVSRASRPSATRPSASLASLEPCRSRRMGLSRAAGRRAVPVRMVSAPPTCARHRGLAASRPAPSHSQRRGPVVSRRDFYSKHAANCGADVARGQRGCEGRVQGIVVLLHGCSREAQKGYSAWRTSNEFNNCTWSVLAGAA